MALQKLRVNHRVRRRHYLAIFSRRHLMVVGDHHRHAQFLRQRRLRCRRNPVVAGHDGLNTVFLRPSDDRLIDAVPVFYPVRNIVVAVRPQAPESRHQDICCTDPVDIIVPHHPDSAAGTNLLKNQFRCRITSGKQLRGVKVPEGSVKIRLYILIPRNSPVCDNPGRHGVDAEVRRDVCKVGPLRVHHPDFRWHLCHTVISSFLLKFYCRLYSFSRLLRSRQSGSCVSTILQKACE